MPRENERKIECVRIGRGAGWAWGAAGLAPGSFANGQSFEMVNDSQGPTVERDEPPRRCGPGDELNARNCRIRIARSIRAQLICSVCRLPVCRCRRRREGGRERERTFTRNTETSTARQPFNHAASCVGKSAYLFRHPR